jgi:hypothetical protein
VTGSEWSPVDDASAYGEKVARLALSYLAGSAP